MNVYNATELGQDLTTNGLSVALYASGNCTGFPLSSQIIPGNAMHTEVNKKFTIYAFEGNVPNLTNLSGNFTVFSPTYFYSPFSRYDHLEMNLMVDNSNNTPTTGALHVEANANLCNWGGISTSTAPR